MFKVDFESFSQKIKVLPLVFSQGSTCVFYEKVEKSTLKKFRVFLFGDIFGCFFLEILVEHQNLVEFLVEKKIFGGKKKIWWKNIFGGKKIWWKNFGGKILVEKYLLTK